MIAHVCASTGWTWDYVSENIDLPRLGHLSNYWQQHPPIHVLAAAYMGFKGSNNAVEQATEDEALNLLGGNTLSESEFNELLRSKGIVT